MMAVRGRGARPLRRLAAAALAAAALASPAAARDLGQSGWVRGGLYVADVDSSARVGVRDQSIGTDLDFETDLRLDRNRALPSLAAGLSLGGKWRLTGDLFTLARRGTRNLARDIVVDDVTYPVGATIRSGLRSTTFRAAVGYSFLAGPDHDVGAALGLHLTDFSMFVEGTGSVGNQAASAQRRQRQLLAPLPTLGLYGRVRLGPAISAGARIDYLKLRISDYTGELINAEVGAAWQVAPRVSIGAQYRHVDYGLDVRKPRWDGGVSYRFSGPVAFVELGF
ncbi:MAG: outer membrane beta-barrel protein [Sphingomonadaceae bacterium]